MNLLLPIAALGTLYVLNSKKSTKSSSGKPATFSPYFSNDCQWLCLNQIEGFDFSKDLYNNQKFYSKYIEKYINESDYGIQSLSKELMKKWKKCKIKGDDISKDDPLTLRYAYASSLPTAAFYLALSEKITDLQLSMWLGIEYPKILKDLGLLIPGEYKLDILQSRFDAITPEILTSMLSKLYILIPEFRNIQAELIATILMIQLSQIVEAETKDKCIKIIKMQYGDFSSLSGKLDLAYQKFFNRIFDAVLLAKEK